MAVKPSPLLKNPLPRRNSSAKVTGISNVTSTSLPRVTLSPSPWRNRRKSFFSTPTIVSQIPRVLKFKN